MPTKDGQQFVVTDIDGTDRIVWLLHYCEGELLETVSARSDELLRSFGRTIGLLDNGLRSFTHPAMHPGHEWELTRAGKSRSYVQHVPGDAANLVDKTLRRFERETLAKLSDLPHSVIHNDANDGNVLVNGLENPVVSGVIDFGDISYQPTICDVAIALAYVAVNERDPLPACARFLAAYTEITPLSEVELAVLLDLIMARLAVSISISAGRRIRDANDPVGRQDKRPAIRALERLDDISPRLAEATFRHACSLPVVEQAAETTRYIQSEALPRSEVIRAGGKAIVLDLSTDSDMLGSEPDNIGLERLTVLIDEALHESDAAIGFGRYAEPRVLYNNEHYGDADAERRTVHLGIDIFCPAGSPVFSPLDATVDVLNNNDRELDYGPMIVLRHSSDDGGHFYTLYGHLGPDCLSNLKVGQTVAAGQQIAVIGRPPGNGNWPPHLHMQVILDLLGLGADFPGVARASQQELWCALSPSPACFFPGLDPNELRYKK
jgi:Ser/Thr protein kinase RdoA (MazF antagonist)